MPLILIFTMNIATYFFEIVRSANGSSPEPVDLITWGGNVGSLTLGGESYRLLASMFLHASPEHLIVNMFMLFQIGIFAQKKIGKLNFSLVYLVSGLFGSLASAFWQAYHVHGSNTFLFEAMFHQVPLILNVSVGASGAIMGIAGASFSRSLRREKNKIHQIDFSQNFIKEQKMIGLIILLNLFFGLTIPGVDNSAHFGGLIVGLLLGLIIPSDGAPLKTHLFSDALIFAVASGLLWAGLSLPLPADAGETAMLLRDELRKEGEARQQRDMKSQVERYGREELKSLPKPTSEDKARGRIIAIDGAPSDFVLNSSESIAYVSLIQENAIVRVDLDSGKVTEVVKGADLDSGTCRDNWCAGQGASGVAVSKDESWALVTSLIKDQLSLVDLKSGQMIQSFLVGRFPRNVLISSNEDYAFVLNSLSNSVSVFDIQKRQIMTVWQLKGSSASGPYGRPTAMSYSKTQNKLFVINDSANSLEIFDTLAIKPIASIEIADDNDGLYDLALSADEKQLIVLTSKGLAQVDITSEGQMNQVRPTMIPFCRFGMTAYHGTMTAKDQGFVLADDSEKKIIGLSLKSLKTIRLFPSTSNSSIKLRSSSKLQKLFVLGYSGWPGSIAILDWDQSLEVPKTDQINEHLCFENE